MSFLSLAPVRTYPSTQSARSSHVAGLPSLVAPRDACLRVVFFPPSCRAEVQRCAFGTARACFTTFVVEVSFSRGDLSMEKLMLGTCLAEMHILSHETGRRNSLWKDQRWSWRRRGAAFGAGVDALCRFQRRPCAMFSSMYVQAAPDLYSRVRDSDRSAFDVPRIGAGTRELCKAVPCTSTPTAGPFPQSPVRGAGPNLRKNC
jgi:hypothetical protein